MNVIFMGTPDFAATTLKAIVNAGHNVVLCVTQPDRPSGRGNGMQSPFVKVVAEELGIMVYQPESVKDPAVIAELKEINADIFVVAAYGQILPKELLEVPKARLHISRNSADLPTRSSRSTNYSAYTKSEQQL